MVHSTIIKQYVCIAKCAREALLLAAAVALLTCTAGADNLLNKAYGYWSDPTSWSDGVLPTSDVDSPHASIRNDGTLVITNGDDAVCSGFNLQSGILEMEGGSLTTYKEGEILTDKKPVNIPWEKFTFERT